MSLGLLPLIDGAGVAVVVRIVQPLGLFRKGEFVPLEKDLENVCAGPVGEVTGPAHISYATVRSL